MLHYVKTLSIQLIPIIYSYVAWMKRYSRHPEKYPVEKRYARLSKLVRQVTRCLDVEFHIEGEENLLSQPMYFVPNHLAFYDPLSMICVLHNPTSFVAKIESMKMPFVGTCIKVLNGLFIDREDIKQSLKVMMKLGTYLENPQQNWIIFPEGTRNTDPLLLCGEFHHGSFKPAMKNNVPIVPVAIYGTQRVLHIKPQYKKYPIFIQFLKPIMPEDYASLTTKDVAAKVQNMVQSAISFHLRPLDHAYMSSHYPKKYRFNHID